METARRIYRNTLYLGIAEVVSRILQFVVMLYAARQLTQEEFGAFNFALALAFVAMILADMGVNLLLVRTAARDKALLEKFVTNGLWLKLLFSAATFLGLWLLLLVLGYRGQTLEAALVMLLFAILSTFTDFMYSIFRAFERMEFDSFLKIMRMTLLVVFSLAVLAKGLGVVTFSLMFVVVECIVALAGFIIVSKKFITRRLRLSWLDSSYRKRIASDAFPFGLSAMFGSLYFYASILILSAMNGELEVAQFSSAYNIALALLFIPTVYTNALYPVLSRMFIGSKKTLSLMYGKSMKYLLMVSLPIAVFLLLLPKEIMGVLYGGKYDAAIVVLQVIAAYIVLKFINFLLGIILSSADKQWERMKAQGIVAGVNLLSCIALIWQWGFIGAAWATLLTEIALFGLYIFQAGKVVSSSNLAENLLKPVGAAVVLVLCTLLLPFHHFISAAIGGFFYVVALFVLRAFDEKDREIVRGIFANDKL